MMNNLHLLSGFQADIRTVSHKISIVNTEYLTSEQNIYQGMICSDYAILYFFFNAPQTVEIFEPDSSVVTVPSDHVFSVREKTGHRFHFMPENRPQVLIIYYKISPAATLNDEYDWALEDEADLIRSFQEISSTIFPINERLQREFQMVDEYLNTRTPGDVVKLRNQICNIFFSVFQLGIYKSGLRLDEKTEQLQNDNINFSLIQYITDHPYEELLLENIASRLHYTPRHTQRLISSIYGDSFSKVVTNMNLSHAMELLCDTDLSISEIAHITGFANEKSMAKKFKNATGSSPTLFRNRYRSQNKENPDK